MWIKTKHGKFGGIFKDYPVMFSERYNFSKVWRWRRFAIVWRPHEQPETQPAKTILSHHNHRRK